MGVRIGEAPLAQWIEHSRRRADVEGSSLPGAPPEESRTDDRLNTQLPGECNQEHRPPRYRAPAMDILIKVTTASGMFRPGP